MFVFILFLTLPTVFSASISNDTTTDNDEMYTKMNKLWCKEDSDCKPYYFCHHYLFSSHCETNLKLPAADEVNVGFSSSSTSSASAFKSCYYFHDSGVIPLHSVCVEAEVASGSGVDPKFATSRCYPQLGYVCAKSYYMPCTPNFNPEDGSPIPGQEESCPENFTCTERSYSGGRGHGRLQYGDVKLCVPNEPTDTNASKSCESNFDCGYSPLGDEWNRCSEGRCLSVLE